MRLGGSVGGFARCKYCKNVKERLLLDDSFTMALTARPRQMVDAELKTDDRYKVEA